MPLRLKFPRLYTAALLLSLSDGRPATVLAAGDALAALSTIRIDNFGQVSPTYFRGAQPHGQDYATTATPVGGQRGVTVSPTSASESPARAERK